MSEYQYDEFAAVDQPLSPQQQAELRAKSSRDKPGGVTFQALYRLAAETGNRGPWGR